MNDLQVDLSYSKNSGDFAVVERILLGSFKESVLVCESTEQEDKKGIDYWVCLNEGNNVAVDLKLRRRDFCGNNAHDIALEVWSVIDIDTGQGVIKGWTLDETKHTDYVLFLYSDTMRWHLFPFQLLRAAFENNVNDWCRQYKTATQNTGNKWASSCVFVPVVTVWRAMYNLSNG